MPTSGLASATIYVVDDAGRLLAIEDRVTDGHIMWTQPLGGRAAASASFADNRVFAGVEDGTLRAFDAGDINGQLQVALSATPIVDGSPSLFHGLAAVTTADGNLKVFGNAVDEPEPLTVLGVTSSGVLLSWAPVTHPLSETPVSGYRLYRTTAPGGAFSPVAFIPGTQGSFTTSEYTDASFGASCVYYYALTALDVVPSVTFLSESTYSNVVEADLPPEALTLALSLLGSPAVAGIGETVTYRLVVRNAGIVPVDSLNVAEVVPSVFTGMTTDQPAVLGPPTASGSVFTWGAKDLAFLPGDTLTLTITGRIGAVCVPTTMADQAAVAASGACGATVIQANASPFVVGPAPLSLSVATTQSPAAPSIGHGATYRIVVTNTGSATLTSLVVVDTLPSVFVNATTSQPLGLAAPVVSNVPFTGTRFAWSAAGIFMAPGDAFTFTVTGQIRLVCAPAPLGNTAVAVGGDACGQSAALSTVPASTVLPPVTALTAVKEFSPEAPVSGSVVTYRIVVTNEGTDTVTSLEVVDTISVQFTNVTIIQPQGFLFPTAAPLTVCLRQTPWGKCAQSVTMATRYRCAATGLAMAPGVSFTFTITSTAPPVCSASTFDDRAVVHANTTCSATAFMTNTVEFTVVQPSALSVAKTQIPEAPVAGGSVTYRLDVTNTGAVAVTGLELFDTVPDVLTAVTTNEPAAFRSVSKTPVAGGTRYRWTANRSVFNPGVALTFTIT
ncbi:MAG: PQQ-binding-like beta-propeller repeat protein, partial [bacterium]